MKIDKVLVVDDDASVRTIAEISLAEVGGFQVVTAASPAEALVKAEEEMPDLILADVRMPEMHGPELIARLRENAVLAKIPVILMSASINDEARANYQVSGAAGVVWKPFDPMKLPGQLQAIVADL